MSSPIARAIRAAQRAASRVGLAETVIYRRGEDSVEVEDCIRRRPEYLVDEMGGTRISHEELDWTIPADGLVFAGTLNTPEKAARIETISGEIYEVLPRNGAECWRWEAGRMSFRVYTKKVDG